VVDRVIENAFVVGSVIVAVFVLRGEVLFIPFRLPLVLFDVSFGANFLNFTEYSGASTKPGTWNIPEHPGTSRNIPEHPGTGQIITK